MIKKITLLLFCVISLNNLCAQSKNNIEDIFKMQLFLNKKNSNFSDMNYNVSKNDSLFKIFKEALNIKIDTLKIENKLYDVLGNNYQFFKLEEKDVSYNREFKKNEYSYLIMEMMINSYYVLCIDIHTGASYRLAGFDTNDFLGFLSDFKEEYLNSNFKKLNNSIFLKKFKVEYLDFNCLYEGLKMKDLDREKYKCLKRCSDPIRIN